MADLQTERIQFESALSALLDAYASGGPANIPTTRLTLINYTKAKLDEIIPEGEGLQFSLDANNNMSDPMNLLVNAFMDESAKKVLLSAPLHVLNPTLGGVAATIDANDDKIGYIVLPDDFLRMVSLKMKDWKREVSEFITTSDARYKLQRNKYTRGGTAKPVGVFAFRKNDVTPQRVVEYYSVNTSHDIDSLFYVPETSAENLQLNLTDALTWMCAGIILQVTERVDLAKNAFEQVELCYKNL